MTAHDAYGEYRHFFPEANSQSWTNDCYKFLNYAYDYVSTSQNWEPEQKKSYARALFNIHNYKRLLTGTYKPQKENGKTFYINPDIVKMLANLAKNHGYQVVIRPHPNGESALWSGINTLSNVAFDSEGSFEEFFVKWRPSFIATWHSTTLLDGLMMGAMPVTFSTGKGKLVLPLREIALAFPEKRELLESCLSDTATRFQVYDTLQAVIMR
jgi:hypothetical protein